MNFDNPWFLFVLLAIFLTTSVEWIAQWLNIKALRKEPPENMRDVYDSAAYAKSQEYERVNTRFEKAASAFHLLVFVTFWFTGGFAWLLELNRGWFGNGLAAALGFLAMLQIGKSLLDLPFSWYGTFVIEEKFGFNKATPAIFAADKLKAFALSVVIGLPIVLLIMWILTSLAHAWLWAWAALAIWQLAMLWLAPVVFLPLFYKFVPMPEGELRDAILKLAKACGFPLTQVFTVDGSRRSTKANAFFIGFGSNKRIALFDTLVEKQTQPEILAVLAHEIGHHKCGHIPARLSIALATQVLILFLLDLCFNAPGLHAAFGIPVEAMIPATGLVFFGILLEPISQLIGLASNAQSRKHEFEADAYAARATGDPAHLVAALKKLATLNLANLTPHRFEVVLHHSHPPLPERIAALESIPGGNS